MFMITGNYTILNLDLVAKIIATPDVFMDDSNSGTITFYNADNKALDTVKIQGQDKFNEYVETILKPLLRESMRYK